jgi:uncharacterized protein
LQYIGFLLAGLIGITLGLVGGGGSILTTPVLVYVLGIEPLMATTYSLFVVGATATLGGLQNLRQKQVSIPSAFWFMLPSLGTVYLTRRYLLPFLPNTWHILGLNLPKSAGIMLLFAGMMLIASWSMLATGNPESNEYQSPNSSMLMIFVGTIVGILTGIMGAGGGFLIIPALVLYARMPMRKAVGTSLVIIALNTSIGFMSSYITEHLHIDWQFLFVFTGLAICGLFLGNYIGFFLSGKTLKKTFGYVILTIGCYVLIAEIWKLLH